MTVDSLNVLLADDDNDEALLFEEGLRSLKLPHKVFHVHCGDDLFKSLNERTDIDLVIVDIHMPEMSGFECLEKIKTHPNTSNLPVVMMTVSKDQKDLLTAYANKAHLYVVKPYSQHNYLETLRKIFSIDWKSKPAVPPSDDFMINLAFA